MTAFTRASGGPVAPGPATATSLRRVLGLVEVTAGGVGIVSGASIYVLLGAATAEAGALVWLAFVGAAVLSAWTMPRPFAVRGAIRGIPILPVLGLSAVALMMAQLERSAMTVGLAACAVGLAAGGMVRARRSRAPKA